MAIQDGGPAFPSEQKAMLRLVAEGVFDPSDPRNFAVGTRVSPGMSLRDYFAAMAMSGALGGEPGSHLIPKRLAEDSYALADAMLRQREMGKADPAVDPGEDSNTGKPPTREVNS